MKPLFTIFLAVAWLPFAAVASGAKPNILILVADDLGYADVGFTGSDVIRTPNLDRLAAGGVQLTDFRAAPMCSPTRAGMLTGRWPGRFGIMRAVLPPWSTHGLPGEEHTLPELLKPGGYNHRGIIGKWHLGHARRGFLPLQHGFTHSYGCYNGAIDYFTHQREGEMDWHRNDAPVREEGYSTDLIGAESVRFLSDAPVGKPWFLYVPFNAPHAPFQARKEDMEKYSPIPQRDRRAYAAMVDSMDQAIGKILAAVESRGETSNTLVLFFSDNGGVAKVGSNAPYRGHKLSVYEGGTRVCAAVRWPAGGLAGGRKFEGRVGYIDVTPTVLAAAGLPIPGDVDGLDVLPALKGVAPIPERPWFSYIHQGEKAHASVHLGAWKLVAHGDFFSERPEVAPALELYDLTADPHETKDLAAAQTGKVNDLHAMLREFGTWQKPGAGPYGKGRRGFVAPKDWAITNE
ncbi:MAG: sulfatase [Chthoniobacteraceae bacterium]